jgi:hypothetical protein
MAVADSEVEIQEMRLYRRPGLKQIAHHAWDPYHAGMTIRIVLPIGQSARSREKPARGRAGYWRALDG